MFTATNRTGGEIVIHEVRASCDCTRVTTPPLPWTLQPGESGVITAQVDFRGLTGQVERTLTVDSTARREELLIRLIIRPAGASSAHPPEMPRGRSRPAEPGADTGGDER
jgi:hypothetical protein